LQQAGDFGLERGRPVRNYHSVPQACRILNSKPFYQTPTLLLMRCGWEQLDAGKGDGPPRRAVVDADKMSALQPQPDVRWKVNLAHRAADGISTWRRL
jgi:hypothetical protein